MDLDYDQLFKDARYKASRVTIPGMEAEDVEQELVVHVWLKRHKFDEKRSSIRTFANRVMDNKVRDLLRRASAKKRQSDCVSLDALMEVGFEI